jgi:hypothetical protein
MKTDADGDVARLEDALRADGVETTSVRPLMPSLEDVFVAKLGEARV